METPRLVLVDPTDAFEDNASDTEYQEVVDQEMGGAADVSSPSQPNKKRGREE